MAPPPVWFERKFNFDIPVELYPNICVRLRGTPARAEELTRGLTRQQLTRKPEGKWSIQEHVGHLLDLEPLFLTRLEDFRRGAEVLAHADLTNRKTHEAGHNDRPLQSLLLELRHARQKMMDAVDALAPADFARVSKHPRLNQPMRLVDLLCFVAEHDDHHLAVAWHLRSSA
ncbi:MAG: DinB family protein [Candidatus Acidiferrales bacterium]